MLEQNVSSRVRSLVVDVVDLEVVSDDSDLLESGRVDSLALVELIYAIEEEFDVELQLEQLDAEQFRTVRSIAALVSGLGERAA
jgi:acyl carrier protein